MRQLSEQEVLHRMALYCSRGEHCRQDVSEKIRKAKMSEEAEQRIMARLLKEGYIEERRYARSFVNDKLRINKWGRVKIAHELRKKQISEGKIREALRGIDEGEYKVILKEVLQEKRRWLVVRDGRHAFSQLLRFGTYRGFESKHIIACLEEMFEEPDCEEEDME